jgi:Zn-dependent protease
MDRLVYYLLSALAALIALTVHEYCHGYAAYKMGDNTAKNFGRLTLNPIKHIDPYGAICMVLFHVGWAKPVPVNPNNFKKYRWGCFWTSAAGILMNYLMAFLLYPIFILIVQYVCPIFVRTYMAGFLYDLFWSLFACSLSFCVFNLLPLYPLDGFRIVDAVNKKHGKVYQFLREQGNYVLLGLILVHFLAGRIPYLGYIDLLGYALNFAVNFFGKPIMLFWNWILRLIF